MTNGIGNRRGLYRSRKGVVLGVCRGFAEYFDISLFWVRIITLGILIFTGFWPIGVVYLVAALLLKPEPVIPFASEAEHEFYDTYASSRSMGIQRLKREFERLSRRLHRMEGIVTSKDFSWERRFSGK